MDKYALSSDNSCEVMNLSSSVDVILLSEANQTEMINFLFILITMLLQNNPALWDRSIKMIKESVQLEVLSKIKENLSLSEET